MIASWLVLVVVAGLLCWYIVQCARLRTRVGSELGELLDGFKKDISTRAERGQDPDWIRYGEEGDRQHEFISERMRNLATAALATGVGGTMLMLLLHFRLVDRDSGLDGTQALNELFDAMGFALSASGLGVAANLVILLLLLKSANTSFDKKRADFMNRLRKTSDTHPPVSLTATLTTTLAGRLDELLRASPQQFPAVIDDFKESVGTLATVANGFRTGTVKMHSAVKSLATSVSKLASLPTQLSAKMTEEREAWTEVASAAQEEHLGELGDVIDRHSEAVKEVLDALAQRQNLMQSIIEALTTSVTGLESFPKRLRGELSNASQDWASAATKGHKTLLNELKGAVEAHGTRVQQTLDALEDWKSEMAAAEQQWHARRVEEQKVLDEHRAKERKVHQRVVRTLADGTSDIADAAHGLPTALTKELQEGADRLGRMFGSQASDVVADLVQELGKRYKDLGDAWDRQVSRMLSEMTDLRDELGEQNRALGEAWRQQASQMLDRMAEMVREGLEPTVEGITGIGANLQAVGEQVRGAVGEFAEHGAGFSGSMEDAAATFRDSSKQLLDVNKAAQESVDHIRKQHEEMQARMERTLNEVATQLQAMSKPGLVSKLTGWVKAHLKKGDKLVGDGGE